MYVTPEVGKLNGGDVSAAGWFHQYQAVFVDTVLVGVLVGILNVAIFQIDVSYPLSSPNDTETE